MRIGNIIAEGDLEGLETALASNPEVANNIIEWGPEGKNQSDPLHFVSDCVFEGVLQDDVGTKVAEMLLSAGATVDGSRDETPLIGAASLGATGIAHALINAGADVQRTAVFGATALHWAAYMGMPTVVESLINQGGHLEQKCTEFASTPLFWAVQGYSRYGPERKTQQVEAAGVLIKAGADLGTTNIEGASALERSRESDTDAMTRLLTENGAT